MILTAASNCHFEPARAPHSLAQTSHPGGRQYRLEHSEEIVRLGRGVHTPIPFGDLNSRSWPGNRNAATFPARPASGRLRHAVAAGEHEGAGAAHHREHFVDAEVRPLCGLRRTSSTAGLVRSSCQRQTRQPECAPERILDRFRPLFCTRATPGDHVARETRRGHERSGRDVEFKTGSGAARGFAIYSSSRH